jgi:hypothetical protein
MPQPRTSPRQFSDANGVVWRVRELQPADRAPALYFETEHAFRRVTNYPEDWRDLPTGELEILSRET